MPEQSLGQGQTTNKAKTPLHIKTMLYLSDSESTAFLFVTNCRIIGLYSRCGETRPNTGSRRVKRKEKRMFKEIRRKNREIDSDSAKQLLQSSRRGVLAVNGDDGYPYAIPINYLYDDEAQRIYFHGAKMGHKLMPCVPTIRYASPYTGMKPSERMPGPRSCRALSCSADAI